MCFFGSSSPPPRRIRRIRLPSAPQIPNIVAEAKIQGAPRIPGAENPLISRMGKRGLVIPMSMNGGS